MGFFKNLCRIPRFLWMQDMQGILSATDIGRIAISAVVSTVSSICKIGASFLFSKAVEAITDDKEENEIGLGIEISTRSLFYLSAVFTGFVLIRSDLTKRFLQKIEYNLAWQLSHDIAKQEQELALIDLEQNKHFLNEARGSIDQSAQLPTVGDDLFAAWVDLLINLALVGSQCGKVVGAGFGIYAASNILFLDRFFRCITRLDSKLTLLQQKAQGFFQNAYLQSTAAVTIRTADKQLEEIARNDYLATEKLDAHLDFKCADFLYNIFSKLIQLIPPLLLISTLSDLNDVFILILMGNYSLAVENVKKSGVLVGNTFDQRDKINRFMQIASKNDRLLVNDQESPISCTIHLKNVKFSLNGRLLINDVTFSAELGDVIAIVGPSGSGKTTLARLIIGLYSPDEGSIEINGLALSAKDRMKQVAYVPQDPYLFPHLTIETNVVYAMRCPDPTEHFSLSSTRQDDQYHLLEEKKQTLEEAIDPDKLMQQAGLSERLIADKKMVCQHRLFSGGEKQRIALARAWGKNAPVTVCDEVTSGLDATTEQKVMAALLNNKKTTLILITHRLTLIPKVANKIIVMDNGAVVGIGTHAELLRQNNLYANLWEEQSKPVEISIRM